MIVLDASAALEMVLKTPAGARIESRLDRLNETIHAPHLIDVEVAHVLRRMAAKGTPEAYCLSALQDWLTFPLRLYPHGPMLARVWSLRSNFTAYDATYIALAEELGAVVITHDRKLAASGHSASVEVI